VRVGGADVKPATGVDLPPRRSTRRKGVLSGSLTAAAIPHKQPHRATAKGADRAEHGTDHRDKAR
jgi:hypothetical protein